MAAEELSLRGIGYDYVDLEEIKKSAAEVTGRKVETVPQIYLEGKYIGGYEHLMMHLKGEVEYEPSDGGDECRACEG
jgi:glutaredoxin